MRDLQSSDSNWIRALECRYDLAFAYLLSGQKQSAIKALNGILAIDAPKLYTRTITWELPMTTLDERSDARLQWLHSVNCLQGALRSQPNKAVDYLDLAMARTRLGDAAGALSAEEKGALDRSESVLRHWPAAFGPGKKLREP